MLNIPDTLISWFLPICGINRYNLKISEEGKYSLSHWKDADKVSILIEYHISKYNLKDIDIIDGTAGVGGNTITFSKNFNNVYATDISKLHIKLLIHNLNIYNIHNIKIMNSDICDLNIINHGHVLFLDPPWGGPDYKKYNSLTLYLGKYKLEEIVQKWVNMVSKKDKLKLILCKVPNNINHTPWIYLQKCNVVWYSLPKYKIIVIEINQACS